MDYALALQRQQHVNNLETQIHIALTVGEAMSKPYPDGACQVCGSPNSASPHFGSVSCLACAAFFRRTVALNITFHCKASKCCRIYHELRMICRACRYDKCLKAGMKRHCVQKRRPSKNKKDDEDDDPCSVVSPLAQYEMHMAAGSSNGIVKPEPISPPSTFPPVKREMVESASEEDIVIDKKEPYDCQPNSSSVESYTEEDPSILPSSSSFSSLFYTQALPLLANPFNALAGFVLTPDATANNSLVTTPPVDQSILHLPVEPREPMTIEELFAQAPPPDTTYSLNKSGRQMLEELMEMEKESMDRRRMFFTEQPLKAFTIGDGSVPYTRDSLKPHTIKAQVENVKFDHYLGYEYAKKMPFVDQLNENEKNMLIRFCSLGFSVLDIAFISAELIEGNEQIMVFTDGSYSTCGKDDFRVGWDEEDAIFTFENKKKLFLKFNQEFFEGVIHPMRMLKLDRVEYGALKAICSWKLGLLEYTQKMKSMARTVHGLLHEGLIEYWIENGRTDFETRMGEMYIILGTLFEMYNQVTQMYKQLEFFNLLNVDAITKSLLCV